MKRLSLLFGFIMCLAAAQAQRFVQYSADSSRTTSFPMFAKMYFQQIKS